MNIRMASMDDVEKIARNNIMLARESENMEIEYGKTLEGIGVLIGSREKGFYLVMEDGNDIVGQVMITYEWSDWRGADVWWLQSIYVHEEWRKKGVMKKLVEEIKRIAREKGVCSLCLYVHKNNENAIRAYKRIGMKKLPYRIFSAKL